jgi:hypothetical protein
VAFGGALAALVLIAAMLMVETSFVDFYLYLFDFWPSTWQTRIVSRI